MPVHLSGKHQGGRTFLSAHVRWTFRSAFKAAIPQRLTKTPNIGKGQCRAGCSARRQSVEGNEGHRSPNKSESSTFRPAFSWNKEKSSTDAESNSRAAKTAKANRSSPVPEISNPAGGSRSRKSEQTSVYEARLTGYLPFEYVKFSDNQMCHELHIGVDAPAKNVHAAWKKRENFGIWFDVFGKTILHEDKPLQASYFLYYQWGNLPALELYTTMERTDDVPDELIIEKSTDGMPLAATIAIKHLASGSCQLMLRVAYLLPTNLMHYVGPAGVWADVQEMLRDGLNRMKEAQEQDWAQERKRQKKP